MADRFVQRIADLAGRTARRLREQQRILRDLGLDEEARDLEKVIREHEDVVFDCNEDTNVGMKRKATDR